MVARLAVLSVLVACTSDPTVVDAPTTAHDAPKAVVDSPSAMDAAMAVCTGALYDSCIDNTKCMSANCKVFGSAGLQVCTQACSPSNPCPTQNGTAIPCNNMGICRPSVANACTPQ